MAVHELDLGGDAGAVPRGRHFTSAVLADAFDGEVVDAAELVVTELLTNALLHGAPPVRLVVAGADGGARVEVHDCSRALPVRSRQSTEAMTGRGLALVDALSQAWGVTPQGEGKVVWATVTPESVVVAEPGEVDLDTLLAGFDDDTAGPARFTVALGDVPTQLLLAAEEHVDSVVREMTLASSGAVSGVSAAVPASLARLVHDVVTEFAEARHAVKRQALTAAAHEQDRTELHLTLPAAAADAGQRYLSAMEAADSYARSSRLLTLAAPPQHAAFRRWYVTALVDALRRGQSGQAAEAGESFEDHLLAEVDHLAELREVSDRAARLQGVSAALAVALGREQVTQITLEDAVAELGAARGVVLLVDAAGPHVGAELGYAPGQADALVQAWSEPYDTPARVVAQTGRPLWVETREQVQERFPTLPALEPDLAAVCVLPLGVAGHQLGLLRLAFSEPRLFRADEQAFLTALAAIAAQALDRADLYDAQSALADRLVRLQAVTSALTRPRTVEEVLDVAIEHATGLVGARVASISLLREGGPAIDLVRMQPPIPPDSPWWAYDVADELPGAEVIRTGEFLWVPSVQERDARWPTLAGSDGAVEHAFAAMPLLAEGVTLGALTLSFPYVDRQEPPSREFLMAFADVCAQALQRARTAERAADANAKLAFLAQASAELSGTLDIETTLGNLARVTVPAVADCCVVHLLQDDVLTCVAVEHVDEHRRALVVAAQQQWPATLDDAAVGHVVRTGEAMLVPSEERARALVPESEREELIGELGLRSLIITPLTARGRTLGAISFLTAESGREFGEPDLAFAGDLARRAAVAVDNARLYAVASGAEAGDAEDRAGIVQRPRAQSLPAHADDALLRWHLVQEAGRLGSWELDVVAGTLTWDEQCAALFGTTLDEFESDLEGFSARTHPEDLERVLAALDATISTGAALDVEYRAVLPEGGIRHVLSRARGVVGADGAVARVVGAVVDVTELREAARAESRAAGALAGLGAVALELAATATVDDLARIVLEQGLVVLGADGGAVCVRDDERGVVRLAVSDALAERVPSGVGELPLDGPLPGSWSARTGRTVLLPTEQSGLDFAPEMALVHAATGRRAWAALPLWAAGRLLGSLVVSWTEEREFPPQTRELLAAFAAQCAQALHRIQSSEAERRAADAARRLSETLQRSLLTRPPEPDHLEVAVRYVSASQEAQVGGDWYDAFLTRDGALNLVIGDCTGHDREAVAAMAAVRNLLRATAYAVDGGPAQVLTALEETMAGLDVHALATALLARVEQTDELSTQGLRSLVWSSAGHLPPLLRRADGSTAVLRSLPDLMLGLMPSTSRSDHRVALEPGATVLLYTDGLVERRGEDLDDGVERLRAAFTELGDLPLDDVCDALLRRLGADAEDDVALLAVRCHDESRPRPAQAGPRRVPDPRPLDR